MLRLFRPRLKPADYPAALYFLELSSILYIVDLEQARHIQTTLNKVDAIPPNFPDFGFYNARLTYENENGKLTIEGKK